MTGKLRTWTIADCVTLALESLEGIADPLPDWVRAEAEVLGAGARRCGRSTSRLTGARSDTAATGCASTRRSRCS